MGKYLALLPSNPGPDPTAGVSSFKSLKSSPEELIAGPAETATPSAPEAPTGGLMSSRSFKSSDIPAQADPAGAVYRALVEAVEAIATQWDSLPADRRPEIGTSDDISLIEKLIKMAIAIGDERAALESVEKWRRAWQSLLTTDDKSDIYDQSSPDGAIPPHDINDGNDKSPPNRTRRTTPTRRWLTVVTECMRREQRRHGPRGPQSTCDRCAKLLPHPRSRGFNPNLCLACVLDSEPGAKEDKRAVERVVEDTI